MYLKVYHVSVRQTNKDMVEKRRKIPRLIVSRNAFSRFLEKNYGYTELRQFVTTGRFSSRLNSVFLAKDACGNEVFIKACRYGDMSENEYVCGLELWQLAPKYFAKPLAFYSGKKFSFCSFEYVPGTDLDTILEDGDEVTGEQRAYFVECLYEVFQVLQRADIVHRDVVPKNVLIHQDRFVLIDCQLATKRQTTKQITLFDTPLKICLWRWKYEPNKALLEWDDTLSILGTVRSIGSDEQHKERFDFICSELEAARGKCKYVCPYPTLTDIERSMRVCRFRKLFHHKAKMRSRYGVVMNLLQYLHDNHPLVKKSQEADLTEAG